MHLYDYIDAFFYCFFKFKYCILKLVVLLITGVIVLKNNYVFTYGTLLRGERNHHYLSDEDFVCDAYIKGFKMFDLGRYPGIENGDGIVLGELYLVDDDTLKHLDYLEEVDVLYLRKITKIYTNDKEYEGYIYVYNLKVDEYKYLGEGIYSWKNKENRK